MAVQNKEKQEKKKTFARFILVLAAFFALGIAAGVLTVRLQEMEPDFDAVLQKLLSKKQRNLLPFKRHR